MTNTTKHSDTTLSQTEKLSVLIVTWNGDDLLKNCLGSVSKVYGESLEIIVVDNANLKSTKEIVTSYKNAKYIPSETNLGFAGGNNLGLPFCTRKYVLLLNNDTIIHEDSFGPLIEYMEVHPEVAVTQGRMRLVKSGNVLDECGVMLTPTGILYDAYMMLDDSTPTPTRPVHSIKGAMMMIRKETISRVGGLFYDHFHCNYEEKDFCHRIWLSGYEVHYVNTPAIDHLQSQTIARFNHIEILGKTLANNLFSLATTLKLSNACKMIFLLLLLHLSVSCFTSLKGRFEGFAIFARAAKSLWIRRDKLIATRKAIHTIRKCSDKSLFAKIMVRPKKSYYYHYFKGDLDKMPKEKRIMI